MISYMMLINCVAIPSYYELRTFYSAESDQNLYNFFPRWCAFFLVDIPQQIIGGAIFCAFVLNMTDIQSTSCEEPFMYFVLTMIAIIGYCTAMICALLMPTSMSSMVTFIAIVSFELTFAGFFVVEDDMANNLVFFLNKSFAYWGEGQFFRCIFDDLLIAGDVLVGYFDFEMTPTSTTRALLIFWTILEGAILIAMRPFPSLLLPYSGMPYYNSVKRRGTTTECDDENHTIRDSCISMTSSTTSRFPQKNRKSASLLTNEEKQKSDAVQSGVPTKSYTLAHAVIRASIAGSVVSEYVGNSPNKFVHSKPRSSASVSYVESKDSRKITRYITDTNRINLTAQNLKYEISIPKSKLNKPLLKGITATFKSGEITALMGPSG